MDMMERKKRRYDLIILAGGGVEVRLPGRQAVARTLAELKGRRLLDYIMDAVRHSRRAGLTVVVTDAAHLPAFRTAAPDILLCTGGGSLAESAWAAIRLLQKQPGHERIDRVLTLCDDLPFLTGEALDDFVDQAEALAADGVYAIVRKEACRREFPALPRTFFRLREGEFTGGNVSLVSVALFPGCMEKMKEVYAARKNPFRLAAWLGAGFLLKLLFRRLSLQDVEERVSRIFGYRGRAVITDYASIGTDLDREEDWPVAEQYIGGKGKKK